MKTRKFLLPAATAGILALTLSACGGGGGGTTGGGGTDAEANLDGRGPITYVQGKDNNNIVRPFIEKWNAAHPDEKVITVPPRARIASTTLPTQMSRVSMALIAASSTPVWPTISALA